MCGHTKPYQLVSAGRFGLLSKPSDIPTFPEREDRNNLRQKEVETKKEKKAFKSRTKYLSDVPTLAEREGQ